MKVTVKWTSNKYELDLDVNETPLVFKNQLFSLTGVPPERQKLMLKGAQIKDDDAWSHVKNLKDGALFLMMGTAGELPKAPEKKPVFLEDMAHGEAQALVGPSGLVNLGNTCYLNATLQSLRPVREIAAALTKEAQGYTADAVHNIAISLRDLYSQLDKPNTPPVPPIAFLTNFRSAYPQFAQQDSRGHYAQQDAEEAWNSVLTAVKSTAKDVVDKTLGVEFANTSTCDDPEAAKAGEQPVVTQTSDLRLTCHISNQVNSVHDALAESLVQHLEKTSATLQRAAKYTVQSKISKLPKYLTIHFARFFWRADIKQRVKIRRNVQYGATLDMFKYCTPELQAKLAPAREGQPAHPDVAELAPSGFYDLVAVLTHIGASSDSGHYVGWVKDDKTGEWFKYDDDKVSPVTEADVLKLSGQSADGHIAYLCLYRAKEADPKKDSKSTEGGGGDEPMVVS